MWYTTTIHTVYVIFVFDPGQICPWMVGEKDPLMGDDGR